MQEGIIFGAGRVIGGICSSIGAWIMMRVELKAEEKRELDARIWAMSSDIATLIHQCRRYGSRLQGLADRVNRLEGR